MLDEVGGKPVQQLRMARAFPLGAEVPEGFHQSGAEELFPEAVHHHPGHQGVFGISEPVGQSEAVAGLVGGQAGEDGRHVRLDLFARSAEVATHEDVGRFALLHLDHHHGGGDHHGDACIGSQFRAIAPW